MPSPKKPLWWYISAASDRFLGAVIVEAPTKRKAVAKIYAMGIPKDADLMADQLDITDMKRIAETLRERLLTEKEVMKHLQGKRVGE